MECVRRERRAILFWLKISAESTDRPKLYFWKFFLCFILKGNICLLVSWPSLSLSHVWNCLPTSLCRGLLTGIIAYIFDLKKNSSKCVYLHKPFYIFVKICVLEGLMSEALFLHVCVCVLTPAEPLPVWHRCEPLKIVWMDLISS